MASSTTKAQRIGIWAIAAIMAIGTIGSFAIIVLANSNQQTDQARLNEAQEKYKKDTEAYQAKTDAQAGELSTQYFDTFNQYSSRVGAFDKANVTELQKEDLAVGDGETLTKESSFTAYYIGWAPDGKVFDSSIDSTKLKAPIAVTPGGVIEGWTQGIEGMNVGGVRELTIPSALAYGSTGSGDTIAPDTPLKFVIYVIPTPAKIDAPQIPDVLLKYYQSQGYTQ